MSDNKSNYYVWPCGTNVAEEEYSCFEYGFMGDDFKIIEVDHDQIIEIDEYLNQRA